MLTCLAFRHPIKVIWIMVWLAFIDQWCFLFVLVWLDCLIILFYSFNSTCSRISGIILSSACRHPSLNMRSSTYSIHISTPFSPLKRECYTEALNTDLLCLSCEESLCVPASFVNLNHIRTAQVKLSLPQNLQITAHVMCSYLDNGRVGTFHRRCVKTREEGAIAHWMALSEDKWLGVAIGQFWIQPPDLKKQKEINEKFKE